MRRVMRQLIRSAKRSNEWKASRRTAAPFSRRLVIMVKEPHAGRVKTRLAREIGVVAATGFYRHAASAVVGRLGRATEWETWLAVAPDAARSSRFWSPHIPRRAQGGGDLGSRMQRIFGWAGRGPILIVGTDIPAIEPRHIRDAFRALGGSDAVLGPTPDGGYWLVGSRRSPRVLAPFENVRWSSEHTLADTVANLEGKVAYAARLGDVDDAAEWRCVRGWSGRRVLPMMLRQTNET